MVFHRSEIDTPLLPEKQEKKYGGGEHGFLDPVTDWLGMGIIGVGWGLQLTRECRVV